ncbi:MAG: 1-acyl-sn-glycerol-3-phosphate acyltransferase [Candidatus Marinimicrobia bacterium]|nr:1-acyl-sn-glycerol-3-phosphate acyltransferase [Candidatus Neomarinimicrobiota bacterium]MCF7827856.1 1-acyl-sn-glycerol-3-phosphate acyltransferase [Candidatus Neomarinimicrobiota bacterium]MCF7879389.1 1-acyl-sn-glycerol-3-phosphate acyltransferase [Candidatus Neomarinimicrobiota bacterium]
MGTAISITFSLIQWIAFFLLIIVTYELLRWGVVSFFKRRFMRSVTSFLRKHGVRFDQYKLTNKLIIKDQLLHDREVSTEILEESRKKDIPYEEAREIAEQYIDEIVPTFNLLSYYKFGYSIANFLLKFLYEVVIDEEAKDEIKELSEDSLVIYVMNHRSNIDYIVVAFMLMENISVSYAVGEWARVFPLEYIFKSFGAYFIRRNYRDPLYHIILRKYVQLISRNKVTQGIFLEGGLSRDGRFRPPKTGLLDYILNETANESDAENVVFVPVGINYDWILEDKTLISEWKEGKQTMTMGDHLMSLIRILIKSPYLIIVNSFRAITGRLKEHGYASIKFGSPVKLNDLLNVPEFEARNEYAERRRMLKDVANRLLDKISGVVPVTPVAVVSKTLLQVEGTAISKQECIELLNTNLEHLEAKGAQLIMGEDYEHQIKSQHRLETEKWFRKRELVQFEEDLLRGDVAEKTLQLAVELLTRRNIIKVNQEKILIVPEKRPFLEYYANTIRHYFTQDIPGQNADQPEEKTGQNLTTNAPGKPT